MMRNAIARHFSWRAFLGGLVASTVLISALGWFATGRNTFVEFTRFYRDITPESLYYPTARQVASLVEARYDPQKTMVLVGGSSVFRGTGQSTAGLWTHALQRELGDRFVVLNLSMNGGGATGLPSYMTEMLTKQGRRVIYLCDMLPGTWSPQSVNEYYQYLYYEASARGLLIASPARDEYVSRTMTEDQRTLALRAFGNEMFNYEETWQYIGYNFVFTVYSPLMFFTPWVGRQYGRDDENPDPNFHFQSQPSATTTSETAIARGYALAHSDETAEVKGMAIGFPDPIRPRMVLVATGQAPFYVDRLAPDERASLATFYGDWMKIVRSSGITPAPAYSVLTDEDHWDRVHLNETGGAKLARFVAPIIRQKAKELGYED